MQKLKSEITYCNIVKSNIKHIRYSKKIHKLQEITFSILIDLENLDKVHNLSPIFSVNKFNIFSFYEKDHGYRDGSKLDAWARDTLRKSGLTNFDGRIVLHTFPRVLGYVFNPVTKLKRTAFREK